jgi:2-keto-4-pentenoate hydratase/2-oxohepta-3-ene-1,7-dioic acid hydratase in catechol pathway
MRIVRYQSASGDIRFGHCAADGKVLELDGDPFGPHLPTQKPAQVMRLLAPVSPVSILCIGLNYRAHAEETGQPIPQFPVLFMKQPAAIQDPEGPIVLPEKLRSTQVDFEGELVVVIGRRCKNVEAADAHHYILGYTCGNDVSARDWQKQWGGGQFCRGKTFDTFAPIGPWVVTTDEIPDAAPLTITTRVNGDVMQQSSVSDLIFPVPQLIEFLSGSTTLEAGTLIFTGTPSGVGAARKPPVFLKSGDRVEVEISRIGTLGNPVMSESGYGAGVR